MDITMRWELVLLAICLPACLSMNTVSFSYTAEITKVEDWPETPIQELDHLGQIGGVATDSSGDVYVFHRGERVWDFNSFNTSNIYQHQADVISTHDPIIAYSPLDGKIIKRFGKNLFYLPYGITIDSQNNIWLTDVALHQVFKIPAGSETPSLTIGTRFRPGNSQYSFCMPTDVAVLSTGDFFVADGFCNTRVVRFAADGAMIAILEELTTIPGLLAPLHYSIVHSLALAEDKNLLCVADRENGRIICFNAHTGVGLNEIKPDPQLGSRLYSVEYSPQFGGVLLAVSGKTDTTPVKGFIIAISTGTVIGEFGPSTHNHTYIDITMDSTCQKIYIGENDPNIVTKYSLIGNYN